MNDFETKDIVSYILAKLGYKKLAVDAKNGNNISAYIGFIKHRYKNFYGLDDFINYFL